MRKTIQEVLDYIHCPMLHRYRHVKNIDTTLKRPHHLTSKFNQYKMEEVFDSEVHKLGYHVFNYVQNGEFPRAHILRQKWSKLWCDDKTIDDVMQTMKTDRKRLEVHGLTIIENLISRFKDDPGIPLLVGKVIEIDIGKHQITVTLDLVRELFINKKPVFQLMEFQSGLNKNRNSNNPMNLHIHNDINVTAASMAFRAMTGSKEDYITYYDLVSDKEYNTSRDESDYKSLEYLLDNVEKAIDQGIVYPVLDRRCLTCPFQYECKRREWYDS
jgi:CRISPR/Cas system-associated exonuclease Cas4 (RecB family)